MDREAELEVVTASAAFAVTALMAWRIRPPAWSGHWWPVGMIAAPTGWTPFDAVLRAALAAAFVLGAARVRAGWPLAAALAVAAVLVVAESPVEAMAWVAVGALGALVLSSVRFTEVVAAAAGLLVQVILRLEWPLATGASLAAGVATASLVLGPACYALPGPRRRSVAWSAGMVVAFGLVATAGAAVAAAQARAAVERGIDAAEEGIAALGDDSDLARRKLGEATAAFSDAEADLTAWWARPARSVPIVSQQLRAVTAMASSGRELASVVGGTVELATTDAIRPRAGVIDLDAVDALALSLDAAHRSLLRVGSRLEEVDSPWLVAPLEEVHGDLSSRVSDATARAANAAEGARLAPALLGQDELRRYFVAVLTPAEARGGGGFMGNWAELTAKNGRLEMTRFGRVADLSSGGPNPDGRVIEGQDEYLSRYGARTARYWGLVNFSPDFPTVADVIRQLYPQSGGREIDGVIAVDPYAFEALLDVVGPVSVPGSPARLTAGNAARVLLHEQYVAFAGDPASGASGADGTASDGTSAGDDAGGGQGEASEKSRIDELIPAPPEPLDKDAEPSEEEREDFLAATTVLVFERLIAGEFDSPRALVDSLGPAVAGRHLQLASFHDEEQAFFERIDAGGAVPELLGDSIGFVGQNYGGNKIDWFLRREATYEVEWDPGTGAVRSSLEIRLHNDAPAAGLPHSVIGYGGDGGADQPVPADGENLMELSLYTALTPFEVTVDGAPQAGALQEEFGRSVFSCLVVVPPGSSRVVRIAAEGNIGAGDVYRLEPLFQPVVTPDRLDVRLTLAEGWTVGSTTGVERGTSSVTASWLLDRRRPSAVEAERVGQEPSLLERLRGEG